MNFQELGFRSAGFVLNTLSRVRPTSAGKLGLRLFATPPPPRIRPKERAFLDAAERRNFVYDGTPLPVYHWGPASAPYVFCSYGWGYNAGRWRHYVPELLAAGYRVVAFDPPGHGLAPSGQLDYLLMVQLQEALIRRLGRPELVLGHSFGGGCLVETLAGLPPELRPRRACFLAIFSEVMWIFLNFRRLLRLRPAAFTALCDHIERRTGRSLADFDVAVRATQLADLPVLLIHDPADATTAFRNALRNHSYWRGSYLQRATAGGGHHLGTSAVTGWVMDWLLHHRVPPGATHNRGDQPRIPAVLTEAELLRTGETGFFR